MNTAIQEQAERAALAQRLMLQSLTDSLRTYESQLSELEGRAARQAATLKELYDMMTAMIMGFDPEREGAAQASKIKVRRLTSRDRFERAWSKRSDAGYVTPNEEDDWPTFIARATSYLNHNGIKADQAPLMQLLPPGLGADIWRDYKKTYCAAPWDPLDYGVVAVSVLAGALVDFFLVATPNGSFQGEPQRQSPLTKWMKEESKKLAPIRSGDNIKRNAFEAWIAKLTTAAEKWAKVPYDVVSPKDGLTPNVHRLASLGHDPILGLVFGVLDIMSGRCTFINGRGAWDTIQNVPGHAPTANVPMAIAKVIVHWFSDVFTTQGLPAPLLSQLQLIGFDSGFVLKKGGESVSVRDLSRYMYSNGYDLRHFATAAIVPGVAELIHWVYHGLRAYGESDKPGKADMAQRLKREQMLLLTHALLSSANVLKTALYGWNPMALNLAQYMALATRMMTLVKLTWHRDRQVQDRLIRDWEDLHAQARNRIART